MAADEQPGEPTKCGYIRQTWDGPYRMDDECQAAPHEGDEHGPWKMLPIGPPTQAMLDQFARQRAAEIAAGRKDAGDG